MLFEASMRPRTALSPTAFNMKDNKTYTPVVKNGVEGEILEGFGGVICRRKDMPLIETWKPATPEEFAAMTDEQKAYFLGDDCVMSYALRKKNISTLAIDTFDLNRNNTVTVRDVDAGPDALKHNKHTGGNMKSYAMIKKSILAS
jgi:hypothetical protein